jgi:RNA polymerase sigma-70 factor (ECF subfamily)
MEDPGVVTTAPVAAPLYDGKSFISGLFSDTAAIIDTERPWGRRHGGQRVGTDAGAETGPYRIIADAKQSRQALTEQLFAANYPKLAGWVRRLVDDDDTAHEIASEAFVRLWSKWTSPDKLNNPQSYLYMIATNLVRDHWRKTERERRAMSRAIAGSIDEPQVDPAQDVDVRALLEGLPARLREPFLLHYYAGFGVKEIAALLNKPEGTVKADLYRARAELKEAIARAAATGPMPIQRPAPEQGGRPKGGRKTNAS